MNGLPMNDAPDYGTPEFDPVELYAGWDDEAGFITTPTPVRAQAEADLTDWLAQMVAMPCEPANARVRAVHLHDDGVVVEEEPADGCRSCAARLAA